MKLHVDLWTMICVLNTIKFVTGTICGENWILSEASQKCFNISNERLAFNDATIACGSEPDGQLASVALMEDVKVLREHNRFQGQDFWVYLYKENHDPDIEDIDERRRQFSWGDRSPYTDWAIGFWDPWEPSPTERHGRLAANMTSFKANPDDTLYRYICQKPIPDTTTKVISTQAPPQEPNVVPTSSPSTNISGVDVSTEMMGGDTMALMSNMDNKIYIAYGAGGGVALILIIVVIVAVVLVKKRKSRAKNNPEPSVEYSYANEIATSDLKYDDQQYANVNMEYSTVADMQPDPGYDSVRDNSNVKHVPMYPSYDEVNFTDHNTQKVVPDYGEKHNQGDPGNALPLYSVVDVSKKPGRGYQNVDVNSGADIGAEKEAAARRISNMYSKPVKR